MPFEDAKTDDIVRLTVKEFCDLVNEHSEAERARAELARVTAERDEARLRAQCDISDLEQRLDSVENERDVLFNEREVLFEKLAQLTAERD